MQNYDEALVTLSELTEPDSDRLNKILTEVQAAKADHERQEKELYKKMIQKKKNSEPKEEAKSAPKNFLEVVNDAAD